MLTADQERTASPETLVLSHAPLVEKMATAFARYGVERDELIQEGNIGLIVAANKFKPELGYRFSTYARWWVKATMRDYVVRSASIVARSRSNRGKGQFFRCRPQADAAFDGAFEETLICSSRLPDELAGASIDAGRVDQLIERKLEERERMVLRRRANDETLDAIGAELGVSKERVRQIENRAIEKLRLALTGSSFPPRTARNNPMADVA
jgi:RNA polymerase sigma-32 factor